MYKLHSDTLTESSNKGLLKLKSFNEKLFSKFMAGTRWLAVKRYCIFFFFHCWPRIVFIFQYKFFMDSAIPLFYQLAPLKTLVLVQQKVWTD